MKLFRILIAAGFLFTGAAFAAEFSQADLKWGKAVEKMILSGKKDISTPSTNRVEIAKKLAVKYGRTAKVMKTKKGYRIAFTKKSAVRQTASVRR